MGRQAFQLLNITCFLNMKSKDIVCFVDFKKFVSSGRTVSCYIFVGFKNSWQFTEMFKCLDFTFL